ncbi:nucleotide sugar dehydrogenase [Nocardioides sp. zg-1228]|uniref:nucleotide sugar dehydrogenase n=1 Tax=Nocardioides sp. zg-1228 TaxID=2763008 RepID=UPI001642B342|nr:nucleotide sugar dehydrogenase [Nocardioides sp. zg-1228]MBC2934434.1 nucleotide sugar dehydrogenase [Nocardioides sp. zg-1228]QSF59198.1 nucleotide sugar dehydrogenase [Nocardioides sp. zg-1228]
MSTTFDFDVCIVGGAGHVGFPLAVAFASRGLRVAIHDINDAAVASISDGVAPFLEPGVEGPLAEALASGALIARNDLSLVSCAEVVIVVVGTPVDQYLSPDPEAVPRAVGDLLGQLRAGQLLVLRSTVFPGVTRRVEQLLAGRSGVDLAFCPERIAEGRAMTELFELPQIVSARTPGAVKRAGDLFRRLTDRIVELEPEEAELAKLFTNSWRYIKFAAANQYFMMANDLGLDFARIRDAMTQDYPRAADLPGPGLAAGPCLFKDTMQLASVTGGSFPLGHSAMLVNEGLPDYIVKRIEASHDLSTMTVAILGMAFKAESDDRRSSLSYRLKRVLRFRAGRVLTSDPFVRDDPELLPLDEVLAAADLVVIGAPHEAYRDLPIACEVVDVWNLRGEGSLT